MTSKEVIGLFALGAAIGIVVALIAYVSRPIICFGQWPTCNSPNNSTGHT